MSIPEDDESELDPVYVSSLRELKWIVLAWAVNFAWVIGYCLLRGYDVDTVENLQTIIGMPEWVFWGVFFPWIVTTLFTAWFALTQMADHPLDDSEAEEPSDG